MGLGFDCLVALLTHTKIRGKEAPGLFVWAVYNPCLTLSPLNLMLSPWSSLLGYLGILQSIMEKSHFPLCPCFILECVKPDIHDLTPIVEGISFMAWF